jgi:tRNA dimethylallyltransferase
LCLKKPEIFEIINADAMQCYKGLDIATNKPSKKEMKDIPHHLFNFVEPEEKYIIKDYLKDVTKLITEINEKNKIPLIVGTYLKII